MRLRPSGAVRFPRDHRQDWAAPDCQALGIHLETVNVAIHELEDRRHIATRGAGNTRRIYHLYSPVFGRKQRAGVEEVVDSPVEYRDWLVRGRY